MAGVTPQQASFAAGVLKSIGAPVTPQNIAGFVGWSKAEGGDNWQRNNPLNTTEAAGSTGSINSVGVRVYPNAQAGIAATVKTLTSGRYGGIISAFRSNNPRALAPAIGSSPWGTSGSLAAQLIAQTLGQPVPKVGSIPAGGAGAAPTAAASGQSSVQVPYTTQNFDRAGYNQAQRAYIAGSFLKSPGANPFGGNAGLSSLFQAGRLSSAPPNVQDFVSQQTHMQQIATGQLQQIAGVPLVNAHQGAAGDVNPIPGAVIGRTDMGVDANLKPGAPILAPNDGKVVAISPNWYRGQPYVAIQLTSGPNRGKVMYVAEQITGVPQVGQTVRRGQPIARYASSGTGIEIGWANPSSPTQTLAQATTGYTEGQQTRAGTNFRSYLGGL